MRAWTIAICIVLLLTGSGPILADPSVSMGGDPDQRMISMNAPSRGIHGPIYILNDNDFNSTNGVSSGTGTKIDPFIIEGLDIYQGPLHIEMTTSYFVIRNCTIHVGKNYTGMYTGMYLLRTRNFIIRDCTFFDNGVAFNAILVSDGTFNNNTLFDNHIGSSMSSSMNFRFEDNNYSYCGFEYMEVFKCEYNTNVVVKNNSFYMNKGKSIFLRSNPRLSCIGNIITQNYGNGISYEVSTSQTGVDDARFTNNICSHNGGSGIVVSGYFGSNPFNYLLLKGNDCTSNAMDGIRVQAEGIADIIENRLYNNTFGLNISDDVAVASIEENEITSNRLAGIVTLPGTNPGTFDIKIGRNNISENSIGVRIDKGPITARTNFLRDNGIGIYIRDDINRSYVYNNYIDNDLNYQFGGNIFWNTTKTEGPNIIGGPFIGGNYWSDYTGSDLDGDGIGDTDIPFGPCDYLPLLFPVNITVEDVTSGIPSTGEPFLLSFYLHNTTFNAIKDISAKVDFLSKGHSYNSIFSLPFFGDGVISAQFIVYDRADHLRYSFICTDMYGVRHQLERTLPVVDVKPPAIIGSFIGTHMTGRNTTMMYNIQDNIDIKNVSFEYRIDLGPISEYRQCGYSIETVNDTDYYTFEPSIGINQTTFNGDLNITDVNGLSTVVDYRDVPVLDVIPPDIIDTNVGPLTEGSKRTFRFVVTDNIGLNYTVFEGSFSGVNSEFRFVLDPGDAEDGIEVEVPSRATHLNYSVMAYDRAGNVEHVERTMRVRSLKPLEVTDTTVEPPRTGMYYYITLNIRQLEENVTRFLYYYFDDQPSNDSFPGVSIYIPEVPVDARVLYYGVVATDSDGSTFQWEFNRSIVDIIPPTVEIVHGEPRSGETMGITFDVAENRDLDHLFANYSFGGEWIPLPVNVSAARVDVTETAKKVSIMVSAMDRSGNYGNATVELDVKDVIPPMIKDLEQYLSYEGGEAVIEVIGKATDNWGIDNVTLVFETDLGTFRYYPPLSKTGNMRYDVRLDRQAGNATIRLIVRDEGGNEATSEAIWAQIEPEDGAGTRIPYFELAIVFTVLIVFIILYFYVRRSAKPKLIVEE